MTYEKYRSKAWFRSYVKFGKLLFGIITVIEPKMTPASSAHYHDRLLETLLGRYLSEIGETTTYSIVSTFYDL